MTDRGLATQWEGIDDALNAYETSQKDIYCQLVADRNMLYCVNT